MSVQPVYLFENEAVFSYAASAYLTPVGPNSGNSKSAGAVFQVLLKTNPKKENSVSISLDLL